MQSGIMPVVGGRIAYGDTGGDGPLVVLQHGLGETRHAFRRLVPLLSAHGYRVVTPELRGHGRSSSGWNDYSQTAVGEDLLRLVDHLAAGPVVLVGHCYAGGAVVWAAGHDLTRVAGVVVLATCFRPILPRAALLGLWAIGQFPIAWSWAHRHGHRVRHIAELAEHRARLVAMLDHPERRAALRAMLLADRSAAGHWAAAVSCPALVLTGADAPWFRDLDQARRQAVALHGRLSLVTGSGHHPHAEYPDRTAAALVTFLTEVWSV